jgi:protein gp37
MNPNQNAKISINHYCERERAQGGKSKMAEKTGIAWTDMTFNPWWGCTKVSPACDNCYAATMADNRRMDVWGAGVPRKQTSLANRKQPITWDRKAAREGRRYRVFTLSMGDVMDGEVPQAWREELWDLINATPNLDWQLLTKRPQNYHRFLPSAFRHNNVWLGTTAENQAYYDARWPTLSKLRERFPAAPLWISYEPAMGAITLQEHEDKPDWLIFGGESGSGFRKMETAWAESMLAECKAAEIPFFMKQMASSSLKKAKDTIPDHLRLRQWPGEMDTPFPIIGQQKNETSDTVTIHSPGDLRKVPKVALYEECLRLTRQIATMQEMMDRAAALLRRHPN